ncbi:glycosyltransferase [Geodermatophilus sp. SYSU D00710]
MTQSLVGARISLIGSRGYPSTYGGFETLVRRLAPALVANGAHVTVYGRSHDLARRERHADGVWSVHTRGSQRSSFSTLTHGLTASAHTLADRADAALVLNVANGFYLPLLHAAGIPTAVNVDGLEWLRAKWGPLAKRTFRAGAILTARYADVIVADAKAIAAHWLSEYRRDSRFIPYGADVLPPLGHDRIAAIGLEPGSYVLAVARLVPENNVDLLLDAVGVSERRPPVVVVGSGTGMTSIELRLRALTATNSHVRWLGHISDQDLLNQLWQNCNLYVHGHSVGGTNPALLQALGAGAPTIALDTPYNREVLGADGVTYAHSTKDLATLIDDLYDDNRRRLKMMQSGYEIVARRYSWDEVINAYEAVLSHLVNG